MEKGAFIVFEGCDGCGKSTQIRLLAEYFQKTKKAYITTREPGGSAVSEKIRNIILDGKNTSISDECEALLFASARVQHLKDTVEPNILDGKAVLCDRYIYSSFAYQGKARGLGYDFIEKVNAYAMTHTIPDVVFFIDFTPEQAFERKHGADKNDRMEQAGLDFHKKVYDGFKECLPTYAKDTLVVLDGKKTKNEIFEDVLTALKQRGIL